MRKGTTLNFNLTLPRDYRLSEITGAIFSITQGGREVVRKELSQFIPHARTNSYTVPLTQSDTMGLSANQISLAQLKIRIGDSIIASQIEKLRVGAILNQEII